MTNFDLQYFVANAIIMTTVMLIGMYFLINKKKAKK
jgi:hypothetical protein